MTDKERTTLLNNYKSQLTEYTKCMQPHLEYIRDRLNFNRVYVESNIQAFCQNERNNVNLIISELDKFNKQ